MKARERDVDGLAGLALTAVVWGVVPARARPRRRALHSNGIRSFTPRRAHAPGSVTESVQYMLQVLDALSQKNECHSLTHLSHTDSRQHMRHAHRAAAQRARGGDLSHRVSTRLTRTRSTLVHQLLAWYANGNVPRTGWSARWARRGGGGGATQVAGQQNGMRRPAGHRRRPLTSSDGGQRCRKGACRNRQQRRSRWGARRCGEAARARARARAQARQRARTRQRAGARQRVRGR